MLGRCGVAVTGAGHIGMGYSMFASCAAVYAMFASCHIGLICHIKKPRLFDEMFAAVVFSTEPEAWAGHTRRRTRPTRWAGEYLPYSLYEVGRRVRLTYHTHYTRCAGDYLPYLLYEVGRRLLTIFTLRGGRASARRTDSFTYSKALTAYLMGGRVPIW